MAQVNRTVVFGLGILLLFLLINFNPSLGTAYSLIFVLTIILVQLDPRITIDLQLTRKGLLKDIVLGVIGYAVFLGAAFALIAALQAAAKGLGLLSIIGMMAEIQPVFEGNKFLSLISFGLLAPIVENMFFFGAGLEYLSDRLSIPVSLRNIRSHAMFLLTGFIFMVFHLTAKGLPETVAQALTEPSLLVTFVFGYFSCLIVAFARENGDKRDLRPSIITHMIANTTAVLSKFKII